MGGLLLKGGAPAKPPTGPPVVEPLPGVGMAGLGHRWHAARATLAQGSDTLISAWPDAIPSAPDNLIRAAFEVGSPDPVLGWEAMPGGLSVPFVRIAGIDLAGTRQLAPPRSFFLVFRTPAINQPVARVAGVTVTRASNGKVKIAFGGGVSFIGSLVSDQWHSLVVNADTSNATCQLDGAYVELGPYTPQPPGAMVTTHQIGVGVSGLPLGTNYADIIDHGTWPFGLSSDGMPAVAAALKAAYPGLP